MHFNFSRRDWSLYQIEIIWRDNFSAEMHCKFSRRVGICLYFYLSWLSSPLWIKLTTSYFLRREISIFLSCSASWKMIVTLISVCWWTEMMSLTALHVSCINTVSVLVVLTAPASCAGSARPHRPPAGLPAHRPGGAQVHAPIHEPNCFLKLGVSETCV